MPAGKSGKGGSGGDEQVEILRLIWNEMKGLNKRVDQTNASLEETNARLDAVRTEFKTKIAELRETTESGIDALREATGARFESLRQIMVESDIHLATALTAARWLTPGSFGTAIP